MSLVTTEYIIVHVVSQTVISKKISWKTTIDSGTVSLLIDYVIVHQNTVLES